MSVGISPNTICKPLSVCMLFTYRRSFHAKFILIVVHKAKAHYLSIYFHSEKHIILELNY